MPANNDEGDDAMALWVRYSEDGQEGFGTLEGSTIRIHTGDMFADPKPTGRIVPAATVTLLAPTRPSKIIALWNNFRELAAKLAQPIPPEPLYLMKAPTSVTDPGAVIRRPASYDGKVVYEGELGIVIGRRLTDADEAEAAAGIFGYTCVNDVTAADIINRDATFAQWVRAKSFDGFGPFGPAVATGLDPAALRVRTVLNGAERQNYPISDMVFQPARLVSLISRDMTLLPGDVIACGTSVGVGVMKEAENTVEVSIEGIGTLSNVFVR